MNYFNLGSKISYSDFNAIVYLLRKFKRLTSDLRLGDSSISSDYGVYNITGGLTSVGGNFILEDDVTITSSDVLLNCFYTFYFTVVDVNLSGTVNRRVISVTGDTGDNGGLSVVLSPDLLESDEVILSEFKVDIVFDEHEYYTPVSQLDITLTVDKSYIIVGEVATVTATVLDDTGTPVEDLDLQFKVNDTVEMITTDEFGVAVLEYTGTGGGWVNVVVIGQRVKFYDGYVTIAEVTGNSITLGGGADKWLITTGDVIIDWGDGTTNTVNNPTTTLSHTYTDGESEHSIIFFGTVTGLGVWCFFGCTGLTSIVIPDSVTSLGFGCFNGCTGLTSVVIPNSVTSLEQTCFYNCTGLTSITIPDSVTSLGNRCFYKCTGLTSVVIPNSVTSLENYCFQGCTGLIDYQLYWTGDSIITYDSSKMPTNTNTIFTIPYETSSNYISKNYPSNKLRERGLNLELTSDKPIIQSTETSTITATLTHETTPLTSKTLSYQIKHGSTIIDTGTDTTDNNGQISLSYTGTGIGKADVIISYGNLLQETFVIYDCIKYDKGTASEHNDIWTNGTVTALSRDSEYSIISEPSTSNIVVGLSIPSKSIRIEFDIYQIDGIKSSFFYQFNQNGSYKNGGSLNHLKGRVGSWNHVVIELPSSSGYHTISNGVSTPVQRSMTWDTSSNIIFNLWTSNQITSLRFKNFKVYPV